MPYVSSINVAAAEAAFSTATDEWLPELRAYLTGNRDALLDCVAERLPGVIATVPSATYLAWLDFSALHQQPDPIKFILQHAKVGLSNGAPFGPGGAGHVHPNVSCPRESLMDGLVRIAKAVGRCRRTKVEQSFNLRPSTVVIARFRPGAARHRR